MRKSLDIITVLYSTIIVCIQNNSLLLKYNGDTSCRKDEHIYQAKLRFVIGSILIIQ